MTLQHIYRAVCDVCGAVAETAGQTEPAHLTTLMHHRAITFAEGGMRTTAAPLWSGDCCDHCAATIEKRLRATVEAIIVGIKDEREDSHGDFGPVIHLPRPLDDEIPF